jgi:hypothetical protein
MFLFGPIFPVQFPPKEPFDIVEAVQVFGDEFVVLDLDLVAAL